MGIAAPSDIQINLPQLIAEARANLTATAKAFANGNQDLEKGISAQLDAALSLYERNKELPLEMNLGDCRRSITLFTEIENRL